MTARILVVEDSRTQAEHLRLLLTRVGYTVDVALTAAEGLVKAAAGDVDLVISDVTMPEMDGFEFCRAMKASQATARLPIILLTSRVSPTDIVDGLVSGADNFIPKSYDDDYLLERIRGIFEQLRHRAQGCLEMDVNLTVGGRRITVNADRQQIMELLFSSFEEVGRSHTRLARANEELRRARAEAEQANRAKSEFLSRMSHELRTPLNAVMGFAQLLELASLGPDERESVEQITAASRHLLGLVDEVLDIGRIDAGELALSPEPILVSDICSEAARLVKPLADARGVELNAEMADCHVHVMADRNRLKQVVLNLLSNAVKYNRDGGTISFACVAGDDERHRIEVADTGPGIAPENLDRLFAPFDRIGVDQVSAVEGAGLGLAVSRRLVEAMGGTLGVRSDVGVGSTFWVDLPVAQGVTLEDSGRRLALADPHTAATESPDTPATVMYVDDNVRNLTLVERILRRRPTIELITATHGRPGLELARQHKPDMILLDLNLPDISGEEVLKQLRADPEHTNAIPIVIVTADASEGQAQRLRSMGASNYLTKPFDIHELLRVVDESIPQRS